MRPVQWSCLHNRPVDHYEVRAVGALASSEFQDIGCLKQREGSLWRGGFEHLPLCKIRYGNHQHLVDLGCVRSHRLDIGSFVDILIGS